MLRDTITLYGIVAKLPCLSWLSHLTVEKRQQYQLCALRESPLYPIKSSQLKIASAKVGVSF